MSKIETCSVKVMRSFDYCHFEVCLSATLDGGDAVQVADNLRKDAARLADKAVEQYKVAKYNAHLAESDKRKLDYMYRDYNHILDKEETDRTPEEQAIVKAIKDREHWKRRRYDYEDDWDEEPEMEDIDDGRF